VVGTLRPRHRQDDFVRGGITGSGQATNSSMAWPICRARRTHAAVDQ
jgi:hypothetical protein